MNCNQAQGLFNAYLDETLTGSMATEFAAHRLRCADCRRQLALMEVTGQFIANDSAAPDLDDAFTDSVVALAARPARRLVFPRKAMRIAGPLLASAACLMLAVIYWPRPDETRVLGHQEQVTTDQLRENVESALARDPQNDQLKNLARELNAGGQRWLRHTVDGAAKLENYGKKTIMDVLELIRIGSVGSPGASLQPERVSTHDDGRQPNEP